MENADLKDIFLSFYGDDFTGSTDVMESLSMNGLPSALFLQPPSEKKLKDFRLKNSSISADGRLRAFGVPGVSRSMSTAVMSETLPAIFECIRRIPSRFFHYKICSTFDSSPELGSIGHAVEIALKYFPSDFIPLIVGAPALNRFCVFGNLFARVGNTAYRLDRHPTMSKHPLTPMHESDLRRHLGRQTGRAVNLVDVLTLEEGYERALDASRMAIRRAQADYLLFDAINQSHLTMAGRVILANRSEGVQLLVGSSGVEMALTRCLHEDGIIESVSTGISAGRASRLLVMAGSCAPGTAAQITWGMRNGFNAIRIDTEQLVDEATQSAEIERIVKLARSSLEKQHTVVYTALGPDDDSIAATKARLRNFSSDERHSQDYLPGLQGIVLKRVLNSHPGVRVVVAGGDTSGHASRALGIYALEILAPIAPGAPLCVAHSSNPLFDGLEIALKGGQNGNERYFESVVKGSKPSES